MKKILLTGGGTAGHVTPNIALLPRLQKEGYEISYIGSYTGIEKELIEAQHIPYYGISSGKLRRYFDPKNFSDPFKVINGLRQAICLIHKLKPNVIFSKGGFVSVPVLLAARLCRVPAIIHESDITPGLANKIALPGATRICCNFPETMKYLPAEKAVLTGSPIRQELLTGDASAARALCGFDEGRPVLFVVGGSSGSVVINNAVREALPGLLKKFQVVHMCGKDHLDQSLMKTAGYQQFEYIGKELRDIFALSDVVVSRAGANSICELLALHKPNLLIPLSAGASRGDQILNARSFERQGFSMVLEEEEITEKTLLTAIRGLYSHRGSYADAMKKNNTIDSITRITDLFEEMTGPHSS